jgi:CRP-like cAMP-binding protein
LSEPLHAAGGVEQLLLPRKEGVAGGADFYVDDGRGGARDERIAARTLDRSPLVFGVNSGFHCTYPCLKVEWNEVRKYSWRTNLGARLRIGLHLTPPNTRRKLFGVSAAEVLQKVPLFSQLTAADLQRVVDVARDRLYPKNSVILFEDDPGDALYVVAKGQVKVVLIGEDGREVILSVLGEGEFFGEMALIDDEPRSAHVIAMEDSTLIVLRREDFQGILIQAPGIALAFLRELSRRLRRVDEKVGSLVLLDVHGRVAQLLLDLADETDGQRITRRLTHHTIAQMIGSSRETVSRTMRELVDKGMIDVSRKDIVIKDRGSLEQAAGRS